VRGNERALGLYWGGVAVFMALLAPLVPRAAMMAPPCLFRSLTGFPCPTCGATHAIVAFSRLDLGAALAFNPLVTVTVAAFLCGGLAAGIASLMGRPLREPARWRPAVRFAALLAIGTNWAWLVLNRL
jgi:uncharacterized protein DUF2752